MPAPKLLNDHVRDRTFRARRHGPLLAESPDVPWPELAALQIEYRGAEREREKQAIALDFEKTVLGMKTAPRGPGALAAALAELGEPGSFEQLEAFFPRFFKHYSGPCADERFYLADFQRSFLREFWRRRPGGERIYKVGLLGVPKGNGKTPLAAGLGLFALVSQTDAPLIVAIAGSKEQAGKDASDLSRMHALARAWTEESDLAEWVRSGSSIRCPEHRGTFKILSSDGRLGQGSNPSAGLVDEWWNFEGVREREAYNALALALSKRGGTSWLLAITTAGWDKTTQLGQTYEAAIKHPELESRNGGYLKVLADEDSGFLLNWYGLPEELVESADIADPAIVRACNPAAWLDVDDILAELRRPDTRELDWRRLHLNQWTAAREAWLPSGTWAGLRSLDSPIPEGGVVHVAIDAALKYDTTAVSWAHRLEDGRIALGCRVWSARCDAPHHVFTPGGRIDNSLVETFITDELDQRYDVREIVGDERFLSDILSRLAAAGFVTAEFPQNSALMANAYQSFYESATSGTVTWHDPEGVFARHVEAAAAVQTERGWRVYKLKSWQPIDALVAAAMARERCANDEIQEPWDPVFV